MQILIGIIIGFVAAYVLQGFCGAASRNEPKPEIWRKGE
jgi:hypothetical protein